MEQYSSTTDQDIFNLYDVGFLANFELSNVANLDVSSKENIHQTMKSILEEQSAFATPFGIFYGWDVVPRALGFYVSSKLYENRTGDATFSSLAQKTKDFVLGNNPWGMSFIVGTGSTYPNCLHSQIANLNSGFTQLGAVVSGPSAEFNRYPIYGSLPCTYANLVSSSSVYYEDSLELPQCNEPALDYVSQSVMAFHMIYSQQSAYVPISAPGELETSSATHQEKTLFVCHCLLALVLALF